MVKVKKYKTVRGLLAKPERWCQNFYFDGFGAYCLVGAVQEVYPSLEARVLVYQKLRNAIKKVFPNMSTARIPNLVDFNDARNRKHLDIVAVLEKARV